MRVVKHQSRVVFEVEIMNSLVSADYGSSSDSNNSDDENSMQLTNFQSNNNNTKNFLRSASDDDSNDNDDDDDDDNDSTSSTERSKLKYVQMHQAIVINTASMDQHPDCKKENSHSKCVVYVSVFYSLQRNEKDHLAKCLIDSIERK